MSAARSQTGLLPEHLWPALRTAVNDVFRPQGGDLTEETPLLFESANRANLRVVLGMGMSPAFSPIFSPIWAHVGLCMRDARIGKSQIRVACVGAVFTAPGQRGRGLASRLLEDTLTHARKMCDLVMASGDGGLYRRQGLLPIPPLARFLVPAQADGENPVPGRLEIRGAARADLESMAALYDAEDMHFIRPPGDWDSLWQAGRLVDLPATFSVVARAGRTVAYLASHRSKSGVRRILEIAGDREAILDAAPRLADELAVPAYDEATIGLCEEKGWTRTTLPLRITAQVLSSASSTKPEASANAVASATASAIPWYGLNYL